MDVPVGWACLGENLMRVGQFLERRFNSPDLASIFANGAVARELSAAGNVVDCHFKPFRLILDKERNVRFRR